MSKCIWNLDQPNINFREIDFLEIPPVCLNKSLYLLWPTVKTRIKYKIETKHKNIKTLNHKNPYLPQMAMNHYKVENVRAKKNICVGEFWRSQGEVYDKCKGTRAYRYGKVSGVFINLLGRMRLRNHQGCKEQCMTENEPYFN